MAHLLIALLDSFSACCHHKSVASPGQPTVLQNGLGGMLTCGIVTLKRVFGSSAAQF